MDFDVHVRIGFVANPMFIARCTTTINTSEYCLKCSNGLYSIVCFSYFDTFLHVFSETLA